ncbi:uncharacterized protein LOC100375740 [Saccoglossus kowalevskii]|uniref:Uncharacterized protein LOC100375740 n=1 Tax=Saccoglossus kowalevskii TaxID=10224 RepID=A0ABM0GYY3_SACKO|nr:PREDICTED: uncharacterized protein LOC100375740 [Saccoglossus kowalevskii]
MHVHTFTPTRKMAAVDNRHVRFEYPHRADGQQDVPTEAFIHIQKKKVLEAYILALPFGWLGFHHFYLKRPGFGLLYFFTFGLLGFGWIFDWFRIPFLVEECNRRMLRERIPTSTPMPPRKRLDDAYILACWPLGILGLHHYYLERYAWGLAYTFTLSFLGIGWIIDILRMPWLVESVNLDMQYRYSSGLLYRTPMKSLCDAYILGVPLGWLGLHHFYLDRVGFGLVYFFTFGLCGFGWLVDLLRMPCLVDDTNRRIARPDNKKSLCDAYVLWFPFGIFGFHHFYLNRPCYGLLYFCTLGLFGIGWLIDFCRLPSLVKDINEMLERKYQLCRMTNDRDPIASNQSGASAYPRQPPGNYGSLASGSQGDYEGYQPGYPPAAVMPQPPYPYGASERMPQPQDPYANMAAQMPQPQDPYANMAAQMPQPQDPYANMPAPPPYTEFPVAGPSTQPVLDEKPSSRPESTVRPTAPPPQKNDEDY